MEFKIPTTRVHSRRLTPRNSMLQMRHDDGRRGTGPDSYQASTPPSPSNIIIIIIIPIVIAVTSSSTTYCFKPGINIFDMFDDLSALCRRTLARRFSWYASVVFERSPVAVYGQRSTIVTPRLLAWNVDLTIHILKIQLVLGRFIGWFVLSSKFVK